MATKKFRPVTPSLRNTTVSDFAEITKKTPEKSLLTVRKKKQEEIVMVESQFVTKVEGIDKNIE